LLGVYWFAGRRLRPLASLTATLLISLSPFREYALLARSYSLLVGFLAISAALWQRIDEKRLMTPLLALFLCLAVCCHHLAVVAILIFGMAELTWSLLSRRIRWGVWAACLSATGPFLVGLPLILHFREMFGRSFYSRPSWSTAVSTYGGYWGLDAHFALVLILFFGIAVGDKLSGMLRTPIEKSPKGDFSPPEIILVGGFLLYPAFLVVLAKLSGGGYGARYGWPAILGLVLGSMYLFRAMWRSYGHILGALVIAFAIQACNDVITLAKAGSTRMGERWTALAKVSRGEPDIPVVIDSMGGYLEAFQYAPPEMHDRLVQVIDESIAMRLDGTDTNVKAQRVRAQFIPLRVVEVAAFEPAHPRFILYSSGSHDWFTQYLVEKGYHLTLLSTKGTASVYMVQR